MRGMSAAIAGDDLLVVSNGLNVFDISKDGLSKGGGEDCNVVFFLSLFLIMCPRRLSSLANRKTKGPVKNVTLGKTKAVAVSNTCEAIDEADADGVIVCCVKVCIHRRRPFSVEVVFSTRIQIPFVGGQQGSRPRRISGLRFVDERSGLLFANAFNLFVVYSPFVCVLVSSRFARRRRSLCRRFGCCFQRRQFLSRRWPTEAPQLIDYFHRSQKSLNQKQHYIKSKKKQQQQPTTKQRCNSKTKKKRLE